MKVEIMALGLAVAVVFGIVVPRLYVTADDGVFSHLLRGIHAAHPGLGSKVWAIFFEGAGLGHFTPTQHAMPAIAYHFAGLEHWVKVVTGWYVALHAASAMFLCILLQRLGSPRYLSLLASAVFALHPVFGDPLSCVLFANNVPGLFYLLAACLVWCPGEGAAPRLLPRSVASIGLLFLSMGCNPNFMVTAPLVTAFILASRGFGAARIKPLIAGAVSIVLAVGLTVAHRLSVYGTLRSLQPGYTNMDIDPDLPRFGRELFNGVIALAPSRAASINVGERNPSMLRPVDFTVQLWSWELLVLVALTFGLAAAAATLGRRAAIPDSAEREERWLAPLLFGAVLALACLAPYFFFLEHIDLHRYVYPAVAGVAAVLVTTAGFLVHRLCPARLRRHAPLIVTAALAPVLFVLLRTDREMVKSIVHGHRTAKLLVERIAGDLEDEPAVTRIYVLGYPRVYGRAGYVYPYLQSLRRMVLLKLQRPMQEDDLSFLADREKGLLPSSLPSWAAVFAVAEDGTTVRRVPDARELTLDGALATLVWDDHFSYLRPLWGEMVKTLSSPDPAVVGFLLKSLAERAQDSYAQMIAHGLRQMAAEQAVTVLPADEFAALAVPGVRARAIRALAMLPGDPSPLVSDALRDTHGHPLVVSAALDLARVRPPQEALAIAVAVAIHAQDHEQDALGIATEKRQELARAIADERQGRRLAARREGAALPLLASATKSYAGAGVPPRSELASSILRSMLWSGDRQGALANPFSLSIRLDREAEALAAIDAGAPPGGVNLKAIFPRRQPASGIGLLILVENLGAHHLPGGESPYAARIVGRWFRTADQQLVGTVERWLPDEGIAPGHWRRVPFFFEKPFGTGACDLEIALDAWGRQLGSLPRLRR